MEVLQTTTEGSSSRTSLLDSSPQQPRHDEGDGDGDGDRTIDEALRQLETFLRVFGFCQYSLLSFALSSLSFLVFGVVTPLLCIELSNCSNCEKYQIKRFELEILVSEVVVAAISLLCISHNLRKYGVRRFLFVDRYHGRLIQFREEYVQRVRVSRYTQLFFVSVKFFLFYFIIPFFSWMLGSISIIFSRRRAVLNNFF